MSEAVGLQVPCHPAELHDDHGHIDDSNWLLEKGSASDDFFDAQLAATIEVQKSEKVMLTAQAEVVIAEEVGDLRRLQIAIELQLRNHVRLVCNAEDVFHAF